ncbi:MAG TPA: aspartate carbamoyltransferase [Desulfotomaculum sp.]|nr:MAG: Aspartate carbamoyltransferase [Desulfotomaculum sp. 46_80]KUK85044.1 MAG: Aspartate carbamoyltransferase [Desulfofundulus kuznetsovii]HAG10923.1 aspartate carbamoyltransferase [Desulfotomaculum sp.]HBY03970.1 aspartate carbamoyltransferase [Desulfotomaculum sp.]
MVQKKNLIGLEHIDAHEIELILDTAVAMKEIVSRPVRKVPTLRGRTITNLFYEPSTRTRTSFELAAKFLNADVINISSSASSVVKGESLKDTVRTIEAMGTDVVIIRHPMAGAANLLTGWIEASVVNAGDGAHEHPTQGLLDLFTVREKKGVLNGLKIVIVGDILHSRVARSDIWGFLKMGASVSVCGPATMMPVGVERTGAAVSCSIDEAIKDADVIIMLRIQLERQKAGLFPSLREYARLFGLNSERLSLAKRDALVMHPGPMNRGIEISGEVADSLQSVINEQVTNGVAVRMAVLYLLAGGGDA